MTRHIKTILKLCLITSTIFICNALHSQNDKKSPSLVGTYIYVLEGQEGMFIFTKTHCMWLITDKGRKSFQGDDPTDAEKSMAFASSDANAGTYKFVGPSRITVHRLHSVNPNLVGNEFTAEYEFEGELCKYWVLDSDGKRGTMGTARRIEK